MRSRQRTKLMAGAGLATMILGALMVLVPSGAGADEHEPLLTVDKVTVCHRTNAVTNPYRIIEVAVDGSDGSLGNGKNDHTQHTGPAFDYEHPESYEPPFSGDEWGDIIPPYQWGPNPGDYFPGLNWNPELSLDQQCQGAQEDPTTLTLVKVVTGDAAPATWSYDFTGLVDTVTLTNTAANSEELIIDPGVTYAITESGTGGVVTANCVGEASESLTDRTLSVSVADGGDAVCTFTNTFNRQQTSSVTVDKTNNADGTGGYSDSEVAPAAGAAVPFQVVISNTGDTDLTLATLTDNWSGLGAPIDLLAQEGFSCTRGEGTVSLAAGSSLPAGSVTTCTFTLAGYAPAAGGSKVNTVALTTQQQVNAGDTSTVTTPMPQIVVIPTPTYTLDVDKLNDADGDGEFSDGENAVAEGDDVTFWVTIRNTGTGAVTLTSLTDSFDGQVVDLLASGAGLDCGSVTLGVGSVLAPGSTTTCTFVLEDYAPAGGEDRVNVISVDTDQTTPSTDDSTVSTPQVLPEEEEPTTTTTEPPSTTLPPTTAKPAPAVKGVQVTRTLPRTGNETRDLAGLGAALIGLGAALVVGSRRREDFVS